MISSETRASRTSSITIYYNSTLKKRQHLVFSILICFIAIIPTIRTVERVRQLGSFLFEESLLHLNVVRKFVLRRDSDGSHGSLNVDYLAEDSHVISGETVTTGDGAISEGKRQQLGLRYRSYMPIAFPTANRDSRYITQ